MAFPTDPFNLEILADGRVFEHSDVLEVGGDGEGIASIRMVGGTMQVFIRDGYVFDVIHGFGPVGGDFEYIKIRKAFTSSW